MGTGEWARPCVHTSAPVYVHHMYLHTCIFSYIFTYIICLCVLVYLVIYILYLHKYLHKGSSKITALVCITAFESYGSSSENILTAAV